MGYSCKTFLLTSDDALMALAESAFVRMLRKEDNRRIPEFAGQRVRQAGLTIELLHRKPVRVIRRTSASWMLMKMALWMWTG